MREITISSESAWEKCLKVQGSMEVIKDMVVDLEKEIHTLKRVLYELKKVEESNANSETNDRQ